MHDYYNTTYFPRLVWAREDSNWHIYANEHGKCASIPVRNSFAQATQFGDLQHVADCKRRTAVSRNPALLANKRTHKALARWASDSDWRQYGRDAI